LGSLENKPCKNRSQICASHIAHENSGRTPIPEQKSQKCTGKNPLPRGQHQDSTTTSHKTIKAIHEIEKIDNCSHRK